MAAERYPGISAFELHAGNALDAYPHWPIPDTIVSDGPYGVPGFHGDNVLIDQLADWYLPHIQAWSQYVRPATTLCFWNTEIGWAQVHPHLVANGWQYVQAIVWDKGVGHIAGNVNGQTIRRLPIVSELCVIYHRQPQVSGFAGLVSARQWLRQEWLRSGLPLSKANPACGVSNAATRKYLTTDHLYYRPPGEMVQRLAQYANQHGLPTPWRYYSLDGKVSITSAGWDALRPKWHHHHGWTNVWTLGTVQGKERYRDEGGKAVHLNQKPLPLMRRLIDLTTDPGDVIWEPFGGLATASAAAIEAGRRPFVAEKEPDFADLALQRLVDTVRRGTMKLWPGDLPVEE